LNLGTYLGTEFRDERASSETSGGDNLGNHWSSQW